MLPSIAFLFALVKWKEEKFLLMHPYEIRTTTRELVRILQLIVIGLEFTELDEWNNKKMFSGANMKRYVVPEWCYFICGIICIACV